MLKKLFVPVAFSNKEMTQYPLNHRPEDGGMPVYMATQVDALLGQYPEHASLCHDGHAPIVHFSECPLCEEREAHGHAWRKDGLMFICDKCGAVSTVADNSGCRLA